ncbi:flagellin [Pigmentiphaga aceris]|uniref:Flagellin n=1 Tax=Pigmentiphaga aceris TaxID=1940612 RepID=A0A5C0B3Z0_9BURK|nr:flagellin [Pigmentiphaga aceris]QEI07247.1 flagellin [Pigmentiphaga aceris]
MAQVINTNIASLNAQRNLTSSQTATQTAIQRLSTGLRINSAKDDAAGLAISERFKTQINGLNQAVRNANDGISLAQTAEGALGQIGDNLQRIRTLSVQSRNATNSPEDRAALQKEVAQLTSEIDRVAKGTEFNGTKLIDGSFTSQAFQVGANQGQTIDIAGIANANVDSLGSWTSVVTKAEVNGAGPAGTAVAAVNGTASLNAVNAAATDGTNFTYAASSISINGTSFNVAAVTQTTATAAQQSLIQNINNAVTTAGLAGLTASTSGAGATSTVTFTNAGKTPFSITGDTFAGTTTVKAQTPASATFAAVSNGGLTINGTSLGAIGATTSATSRLNQLSDAINNQSSTTGVSAVIDGGRIKLTSETGNITVGGSLGAAAMLTETGLTAGTSGTTTNIPGSTAYAAGKQQVGFANLDVSTIEGADNAIKAMDAALKSVNEARADLGAIQNRFSSVVSNLQTTSENLSSSRSRIVDADFAEETAAMTRNQILQQAGTAMLAQANSLPNNVLTLLRG